MSYQDRAALVTDPVFIGRLNACVTNEAMPKAVTTSPDPFSQRLMTAWGWGGTIFMPWVSSAPGFDVPQAEITDGMLLSAVQASWAQVESLNYTPAP